MNRGLTQVIGESLNNHQNHDNNSNSQFFEKLVTKRQLAEQFAVSVSFINKLMTHDGLPHRKLGRAVRFSVLEVADWLRERKLP